MKLLPLISIEQLSIKSSEIVNDAVILTSGLKAWFVVIVERLVGDVIMIIGAMLSMEKLTPEWFVIP